MTGRARTLPEWVGHSPDSAVPPRVRLRVFKRYDERCQCGCNRKIGTGERWDAEDEKAVINGGERRESNLRPFLAEHHPQKTARDVAIKSKTYRMAAKHAGVRLRKGRPMPGAKDSPFRKRMDGTVERRR